MATPDTISTYTYGQTVRLSCNIQVAAVDSDPSALTFKMRVGGAAPVEYVYGTDSELVKDSAGDYHVDWRIQSEQLHAYRFESGDSGPAQGAEEHHFKVRNSRFH